MPFSIDPFFLLPCELTRGSARRTWLLIVLGVSFLVLGHQEISLAVDCPSPPVQTGKDYEGEVDAFLKNTRIGRALGIGGTAKLRTATQDLLGKLPDAGRVYLHSMMYATRCTSIRDNKDISDGEKDKQIGELNVWLAKLIEPQALKSQVPTSVPPPPKQPAKGKESGTPSKVSPPMTPPPQAELKPPQGECGEQSAAVLMRKPRAFVPIYRALLGQLKFENDETDLTTLVKRGSRIRHTSGDYARPENLIQEARFTVICLEQEGELKLETLGPSTYENLPYENQRIVFRNR